jgi:CBS domain containing-hemolysin-like protein
MTAARTACPGDTRVHSHGRLRRPRPAPDPLPRAATIDTALGLLAVLALIGATALFVAAEFALVAVDRERVRADAAAGSRAARSTEAVLRRLSFHLSGAQLGITVCSLVLGFVAEPAVARVIEPAVGEVVGEERALGVSIAIALLLATVATMVLGELVPKGLAVARPVRTAYALAGFMRVFDLAFGPVIRLLNGAANWTVRRLGIEPQEELRSVRSLDEIELLIRSSGEEGTLGPEELNLLTRTIRFGGKTVAEALVPRVDVVHLLVTDSVADLAQRSHDTGSSRFPVCRADLDDVTGLVHVKDVFRVPFEARSTTPVTEIESPAFVVPETAELATLLGDLRRTGHHMAVVIDEYGGTAGIITLEDLLEELVGEIADEHDPPEPRLTRVVRAGEWVLPGTLHHDEVVEVCGLDIPDGEYETLAGFVLHLLGHIPRPGEIATHKGWTLQVEEMERRRIASVLVRSPRDGGAE